MAMRSPLPVAGLNSITLEMWIGASRSMMPPALAGLRIRLGVRA